MGGYLTDLDSVVGGHTAARPPVLLSRTLTPSPLRRKGQGLKVTERSTDKKTVLTSTITQTHTLFPCISIYNSCVKCPEFEKLFTGAVVAVATVRWWTPTIHTIWDFSQLPLQFQCDWYAWTGAPKRCSLNSTCRITAACTGCSHLCHLHPNWTEASRLRTVPNVLVAKQE